MSSLRARGRCDKSDCRRHAVLDPQKGPISHAAGRSEGWRPVAFGDVIGVEDAFGVDAVGAVLLAGAAAGGHHQATPGG